MFTRRRKVLTLLAAAAMALIGAVAASSPGQAATALPQIHSWGNNKCLDADTTRPGHVQLWRCGSGFEQQWYETTSTDFNSYDFANSTTYVFQNRLTGACLTATSTRTIVLAPCLDGGPDTPFFSVGTQHWHLVWANNDGQGWYQVLRNAKYGYCLDHSTSSSDGTDLIASPSFLCGVGRTSPDGRKWIL